MNDTKHSVASLTLVERAQETLFEPSNDLFRFLDKKIQPRKLNAEREINKRYIILSSIFDLKPGTLYTRRRKWGNFAIVTGVRNMFNKRHADSAEERRQRFRDCCRKFSAFLFSHIGLCALVVGYSIMGAATFQALEGQNEINKRQEVKSLRESTVAELWNMTLRFNVLWKDNWTTEANLYLQRFQTEIIAKVKQGYDGKDEHDTTEQWSFSGAFLYSLTVITTIGKCTRVTFVIQVTFVKQGLTFTTLNQLNIHNG